MSLRASTIDDEIAFLDLGAFEVVISNNPENPARKMYPLNEDVKDDGWETYTGRGHDADGAYKDACSKMTLDRRLTSAQKDHLYMVYAIVLREKEVVFKEVKSFDMLAKPFTCAITTRF